MSSEILSVMVKLCNFLKPAPTNSTTNTKKYQHHKRPWIFIWKYSFHLFKIGSKPTLLSFCFWIAHQNWTFGRLAYFDSRDRSHKKILSICLFDGKWVMAATINFDAWSVAINILIERFTISSFIETFYRKPRKSYTNITFLGPIVD